MGVAILRKTVEKPERSRTSRKIAIAVAALFMCFTPRLVSAEDCETIGPTQTHELALFSTLLTKIHGCVTPDGRAAYNVALSARDRLNERHALLVKICPPSNARFIYVQQTLKSLTGSFWRAATNGCEP